MAKVHKSALGKMVDMDALRAKNEHVRAVGNMSVNSRGDVIDSYDRVTNDNNKRVNEQYMRSAKAKNVLINRPVEKTKHQHQEKKSEFARPDEVFNEIAQVEETELSKEEVLLDEEDLNFTREDLPQSQPTKKSSKKLD